MPETLRKALPLIILVAAILIMQNWSRIMLFINPIEHQGLLAHDVVMYTTSWCPYCTKARKFLRAAEVPFTEYDVEKSPQAYAEYERISGRGVPVLKIGTQVIQGFDPARIRQAIEQLPATSVPAQ